MFRGVWSHKWVRFMVRSTRVICVPVKRSSYYELKTVILLPHNQFRLLVSGASFGLALLAADYIFNEKRFFKAAQTGNVQEIRKYIKV